MQNNKETGDAPCVGDCLKCQFLFHFDVCSPESSTYFLDIYVAMATRYRNPKTTAEIDYWDSGD